MSITIILIVITVAISMYAFKNNDMFYKWLMNPYAVANNKEYFRFLTSGFIHADYMHLGFNMLTFYFFGRNIEPFFQLIFGEQGNLIFVVFYLVAIIVSEIPTFLKHRNNSHYNSLGASGGVSAVLFASIIIMPTDVLLIYGIIPIPGFALGILYLIYSYVMGKKGKDNINHDAHLYGAIFGVIFIILMDPGVLESFIYQIQHFSLSDLLR